MIHIVLFEPEIPGNTGNIIRTAMATGSVVHLIKPMGFSLEDKYLRRSGMDYIKEADIRVHENWQDFRSQAQGNFFYMTRYGKKSPDSFDFGQLEGDIYLVFGKESTGIDKRILKGNLERCFRLPMVADARSLNLSNCVAIVVYEVLRQQGYPGLARHEVLKGEDFLEDLPLDRQDLL